jgi:hypothetical protein
MGTLTGRLAADGARYLVIGGQAVRLHGLPRFSMDWDLFVLLAAKLATHRAQDQQDIAFLKELIARG